jgi:hypothetical protein
MKNIFDLMRIRPAVLKFLHEDRWTDRKNDFIRPLAGKPTQEKVCGKLNTATYTGLNVGDTFVSPSPK